MTPERQNKLDRVVAMRQANLTVVMENIEDPRNIAAVMRTCDSVGVQDLYVLNYSQPHRKKWKYKSARSSAKWLTLHQLTSVEECIEILRRGHFKIFTTRLTASAKSLYDIDFTEKTALVFGNEQDGVSDTITNLADGNFLIPQVGMIQSLNISVACAVSLYEAFRQKSIAGHYQHVSLPADRFIQLKTEWGLQEEL